MKIIKFLKKIFSGIKNSESEYYKQMFIKNSAWNTANPNSEEILRWNIIQSYLENIKNQNNVKNKNIDILDLGCGRGWLTHLLSDYGNVLGVEPVKPVVEYAKKLFPSIKFICGTSKELLKETNFKKYDLIVASEVIEHIPDEKKGDFINDLYRLINKNGFLIITTPRKEAQKIWNSFMKPGQPIEDWMSESELEALVSAQGFQKNRLERFAIPPIKDAPEIEIYQLWLFQMTN